MYRKYKIVPFCPYHFVQYYFVCIPFCPYHFVRTILSATILSGHRSGLLRVGEGIDPLRLKVGLSLRVRKLEIGFEFDPIRDLLSTLLLYCIVSIHLYSASCGAHQSEALPMRETQTEESAFTISL